MGRVHGAAFAVGTNFAYYTASTPPRLPTGKRALTVHGAHATLASREGSVPMSLQSEAVYDRFMAGLRELISPYAGKVEYGNLRAQASDWDTSDGPRITNVAIVYETPGGSTDQLNVSFDHASGQFSLVEDAEHTTEDVTDVLTRIMPRVSSIPDKRRES